MSRVPCLSCGDVVDAAPTGAACSCGAVLAVADESGDAEHAPDALAAWDRWDDGGDLLILGRGGVTAAVRRAARLGRPVEQVLALRRPREGVPMIGDIPVEIVAVADAEREGWPDAPTPAHLEAILTFGRATAGERILIHCDHGVGRAPAAALAILADRLGPGREADAVATVLRLRPCAIVNRYMTRFADELLGRGGALSAAVEHHPLLRARISARGSDYGQEKLAVLLMPDGGAWGDRLDRS